MNFHPQPTPSLRRVRKRVHKRVRFKADDDLEDVRIIENREFLQEQQHHHHRREQQRRRQQQHRSQQEGNLFYSNHDVEDQAMNLEGVPSLFRCKSREEIGKVIKTGKGAIGDIFRGYNALHWYCDAKSTSPGIIEELIHRGIDINAVDQRTTRGATIRHTALGYACRNANVKGVRTLLQNGADPCGLGTSGQLTGLPTQDAHGNLIVYPSPLQELLCQPTHGPRPGRCPWIYHLSEADDEKDSYLDEDDPKIMPMFRALTGRSKNRSICRDCAADYHIWEPWPETEAEKTSARERRRSNFRSQILRLGNRLRACVQLLLDYDISDPPPSFPQRDDPQLGSGLDCFLETFWRFYYPLAVCESAENPTDKAFPASPGHLPHPISQPVFSVYGEVCDMLLESAGYATEGAAWDTRGQDRLIALIVEHSELSSFEEGEYFDVDTELEQLMSESLSTYQ
ncbi:hypothetical protein F5B17DRAFT_427059 [Nemania serpens]|nr:hypothetical protein F5B17DRAFT_427059 [Nemania serpens]